MNTAKRNDILLKQQNKKRKKNNYLCFWLIKREREHGGDIGLLRAERMDKNGGVALELENVAKRGQHNNGFGTCNLRYTYIHFTLY